MLNFGPKDLQCLSLAAMPAGHVQVSHLPTVHAQEDNRRPLCAMQVMPKYNAFKISKVPGGEKADQSKAGIQTRVLEVSWGCS